MLFSAELRNDFGTLTKPKAAAPVLYSELQKMILARRREYKQQVATSPAAAPAAVGETEISEAILGFCCDTITTIQVVRFTQPVQKQPQAYCERQNAKQTYSR